VNRDEDDFRQAVRSLIANGTYPDHTTIRQRLGKPSWARRSGLKGEQTRWRAEEVERAGYDWEASKKLKHLVKRQS
jgi:hypothetical protein